MLKPSDSFDQHKNQVDLLGVVESSTFSSVRRFLFLPNYSILPLLILMMCNTAGPVVSRVCVRCVPCAMRVHESVPRACVYAVYHACVVALSTLFFRGESSVFRGRRVLYIERYNKSIHKRTDKHDIVFCPNQ